MVQEHKLHEYYNTALPALAEKLEMDYYIPVRSLCEEALGLAMVINKNGGTQSPTRIYTNFCLNLLYTIGHDMAHRQNVLLPWATALHEKNEPGHDCSTCTGICKLTNDVDINSIAEANTVIIDSLCRLHKLAMPVHLFAGQPATYKELRYKMLALHTALLEVFFIEESVLFTAVTDLKAQQV